MKKEKKCSHKNKHFQQKWIKNEDTGIIDFSKPVVETICADCGQFLKTVRVKFK